MHDKGSFLERLRAAESQPDAQPGSKVRHLALA